MDDLPTPSMHVYQRLRLHCHRHTTTVSLVACLLSVVTHHPRRGLCGRGRVGACRVAPDHGEGDGNGVCARTMSEERATAGRWDLVSSV